ncbi:hypothetical protein NIIDNTM18_11220 [Mycolicibacterium litorale]|uniref:Uncharacterized protein n=2 Tax=Mycolicibacterium litorale TaxID=758802 RepID=A0A6S6NZD6_9MYCO|nr:hypothetical protein NIIDNTM18_11220 [Mycolicibacterium litorale]
MCVWHTLMRMKYAKVLLVVIPAAFLAYSLPPYLVGGGRVPATFGLHHPLLVGHVALGSVAMVSAVAQLWPGLRRRHPHVHRSVGKVYVVAAIPAAVTGLVIGAATPFGPVLAVSNVVLAVLWLWFTVAGYRAARCRRYDLHRRHMLRSGVLALSVITNRIWTPMLFVALHPLQGSVFGGSELHYLWFVAGAGGWLGWTLPLLGAQWWLRRQTSRAVPGFRFLDTSGV